jgi:hypothetical protein
MTVQEGGSGLPVNMCLNQIGLKREGQQGKKHHQPSADGSRSSNGANVARHDIW